MSYSNCSYLKSLKNTCIHSYRFMFLVMFISAFSSIIMAANVSGVMLTTSPNGVVLFGKPVTLTAVAVGGVSLQYKFMNGTTVIRNFSDSNTCTWTPAFAKTYTNLTVVVRDTGSDFPNILVVSPAVSLTVRASLSAVRLTSNPADTVLYGKQLVLTATATGGVNNQYKFLNGNSIIRDFQSSNTCTWTPAYLKAYSNITVIARDLGGNDPAALTVSPAISITTLPALTSITLNTSVQNSAPLGSVIKLTAVPAGGVSPVYKFMNGTSVIRDFSAVTSCDWTPTEVKSYSNLTVTAKDLKGNVPTAEIVSPAKTVTITAALQPTISSFLPLSIATGKSVTITGTNLTGATSVIFNNIASSSVTRVSNTTLKAVVPIGAVTGKISVVTPGGTAVSVTDITIIPMPVITSISPDGGNAGTVMTITGTNLTKTTAVKINGLACAISGVSDTSVSAIVPAGANSGVVTLTTPGGTATAPVTFTVYTNGVNGINIADGASMVWVPAGTFTMGTSNNPTWNAPFTQQVSLSGYWIYKYEVTVAQYRAFCTASSRAMPAFPTGYNWTGKTGWTDASIQQHPMVNVSWTDAKAYAEWAGVSLPTEAQWEYAARGPQERNYPWGGTGTANDIYNGWDAVKCANFFNSASVNISTWPVGSFPTGTSWCGAQDLAGSVFEWCADWYGDYSSLPVTNPRGALTGSNRVLRGGAWHSMYDGLLTTNRYRSTPDVVNIAVGFRCVAILPADNKPVITSFTPANAITGTQVTVTGTNLANATSVKFNGVPAAVISDNTATSLKATVPVGAVTGKITVVTTEGTAVSPTDIIITGVPVVSSFTPVRAAVGAIITITGTSLTGATSVAFNGVPAVITANTATTIIVTVPAAATTGKITVTTPGGATATTENFTIIYGAKVNAVDKADMVWIPEGSFTMGTEYNALWESPYTQQVTLSGYWMYTNEVTVKQYAAFCAATSRTMPAFPVGYSWAGKTGWNDPLIQQHPIVNVSWSDCQSYAEWAGVSLPTEAQWEYAARGTQGSNYPWGGIAVVNSPNNGWNADKCANYFNSQSKNISTHQVGSYPSGASWCGVNDLAGNVYEWCADWYSKYSLTPVTNPVGPVLGSFRVIRGGAWCDNGDYTGYSFRGSYRENGDPDDYTSYYGFRCVSNTNKD